METLSDWKTALASGVKIETLLGLDQGTSQENKHDSNKDSLEKSKFCSDEPLNLSVKTTSGQQLHFQWSSPSLSMISPDVHTRSTADTKHLPDNVKQSSLPSHFAVSPPAIKVNEILGPCFISLAQAKEEGISDGGDAKPEMDKKESPD